MSESDSSVPDTFLSGQREVRFHARVQEGNRIAIPEAERAAGSIGPGDLVSVTLLKLRTGGSGP